MYHVLLTSKPWFDWLAEIHMVNYYKVLIKHTHIDLWVHALKTAPSHIHINQISFMNLIMLDKNNCLVLVPWPTVAQPISIRQLNTFLKASAKKTETQSAVKPLDCKHRSQIWPLSFDTGTVNQSEMLLLRTIGRSPNLGFRILHQFYRATYKFLLKIEHFSHWPTWLSGLYGTGTKQLFLSTKMQYRCGYCKLE